MKIGINCYNINAKYGGGVNTFALGLIEGFIQNNSLHEFIIFTKDKNTSLFKEYEKNKNFRLIEIKDVNKIAYMIRGLALLTCSTTIYKFVCNIIYRKVTRIMDNNADIIYSATTFLFPYGFKKPTVISTHDIQQVHFPEFFSKSELLNRRIHHSLSAKVATCIQASSQYIRNDLLEHFRFLPEDKVVFIEQGVNLEKFSKKLKNNRINEKYYLPNKFLLYPAQLWQHKNHLVILKALNKLKNEHGMEIPLAMTGSKTKFSDQIFSYIGNNNMMYVEHLGLIPAEDLLLLYQKATFLIYPSLHESSGLPLLEAAASGLPIIASDIPPIKELSQRLKINMFNSIDPDELSELILRIWEDDNLRNEQREFNLKNIEYYSWKNSARKYIELFEQLVIK